MVREMPWMFDMLRVSWYLLTRIYLDIKAIYVSLTDECTLIQTMIYWDYISLARHVDKYEFDALGF